MSTIVKKRKAKRTRKWLKENSPRPVSKYKKFKVQLPAKLANAVFKIFKVKGNSGVLSRSHAFKVVATIYSKCLEQHGTPLGYVPLSVTYFCKSTNLDTHNRVIQFLKKEGIVEAKSSATSKETYKVGKFYTVNGVHKKSKGKAKEYRINIDLLTNSLDVDSNSIAELDCGTGDITVLGNNTEKETVKEFPKKLSGKLVNVVVSVLDGDAADPEKNLFHKDFMDAVSRLTINYDKLRAKARELVEKIDIEDYVVTKGGDNVVACRSLVSGKMLYMSVSRALIYADHCSSRLYKSDKQYLIGSKEQLTTYLKGSKLDSYMTSIYNLEHNLYAGRNKTNNRLDTNFTNLKSELFSVIMEDNDLVQIDAANSQPVILANYLKRNSELDTEDFKLFYELCTTGKVYDFIAEKKGISRKGTKQVFFEVFFGKANTNTENTLLFGNLFPSVLGWINRYKVKNNYKSFSILLQKVESELFVDNIYKPLLKLLDGMVFTKHDSIIVERKNKAFVEEFIQKVLEENKYMMQMVWS